MLEQRRQLPAWQERDNILDRLERSQVLVVSGMTGWVSQLGLFLRPGLYRDRRDTVAVQGL